VTGESELGYELRCASDAEWDACIAATSSASAAWVMPRNHHGRTYAKNDARHEEHRKVLRRGLQDDPNNDDRGSNGYRMFSADAVVHVWHDRKCQHSSNALLNVLD